jgi:hypothetical protein
MRILRITKQTLLRQIKGYASKTLFLSINSPQQTVSRVFHRGSLVFQATSKPHADHLVCKVNQRMKTWKTILAVALATLAIGLVTASAFAAVAQPTTTQNGTYNGVATPNGLYAGGTIRGGMMSNGYSPYNSYVSGTNGFGSCMGGARGWP